MENAGVTRVERRGMDIAMIRSGGETIEASHLLLASGREPRIEGFGRDAAGVRCAPDGIEVDARRRTSNPRISAIGDCRQGPRLTHLAAEDGAVVVRNIVFGWPAKANLAAVPRVIYADPELAQLGLTAAEARRSGGRVTVETRPFADDDRAVAEGHTVGFLRMVRRGRRVVGVTIVGRHAGELLLPWSLVMAGKASAFTLAGTTVSYPTRSERSKAVAFGAYEPLVFSGASKGWARLLARLRRS